MPGSSADGLATSVGEFRVQWFHGVTAERQDAQRALLADGCPLPLRTRTEWARAFPRVRTSLLVVRGPDGLTGALGVERYSSRALPGHYIARVSRAGEALRGDSAHAAISALTDAMRRDPRALRVHVEAFSRHSAVRDHVGTALADQGFQRRPAVTNYEYTLVTDLRQHDDASHLASLGQGVRQNIKALAKFPVELRSIRDVTYAPRMSELMAETLARTGARHDPQDYAPTIRLAATEPILSRLMGVFRTDVTGPEALIAFAWGVNHGDHVAYDIGASTRVSEFKNLSLGYPLLWELITWARRSGAAWFDFGGVSQGTSTSEDDRLGRISDFKRRFEKSVVHVADEWVLEPHPGRAAVATLTGRAASVAGRVRAMLSRAVRR